MRQIPATLQIPTADISVVLITLLAESWLHFFGLKRYLLKWQLCSILALTNASSAILLWLIHYCSSDIF